MFSSSGGGIKSLNEVMGVHFHHALSAKNATAGATETRLVRHNLLIKSHRITSSA